MGTLHPMRLIFGSFRLSVWAGTPSISRRRLPKLSRFRLLKRVCCPHMTRAIICIYRDFFFLKKRALEKKMWHENLRCVEKINEGYWFQNILHIMNHSISLQVQIVYHFESLHSFKFFCDIHIFRVVRAQYFSCRCVRWFWSLCKCAFCVHISPAENGKKKEKSIKRKKCWVECKCEMKGWKRRTE